MKIRTTLNLNKIEAINLIQVISELEGMSEEKGKEDLFWLLSQDTGQSLIELKNKLQEQV